MSELVSRAHRLEQRAFVCSVCLERLCGERERTAVTAVLCAASTLHLTLSPTSTLAPQKSHSPSSKACCFGASRVGPLSKLDLSEKKLHGRKKSRV